MDTIANPVYKYDFVDVLSQNNVTESMITITRAKERHINGICEIEKKCFTTPWSRMSFESEFKDNPARYFVAFRETENAPAELGCVGGDDDADSFLDKKIVGYCGYWIILDEGHITNIAVDPSHRHRGIGARLVRVMIGDMRSIGLCAVTLEVRTDNVAAISLYEKFGFLTAGIRKNYYAREKKDAIIMWLQLTAQ